jgi:SAM-dependent methyltransferase
MTTKPETVEEFYDREYRLHKERKETCSKSLHDLTRASRRVAGAMRGLGIQTPLRGAAVLDVGCGLGYYTKVLAAAGAHALGLDFSEEAIALARTTFPECEFQRGSWPEDVEPKPQFDVIWTVNFSLVNTFDVQFIDQQLVSKALARLKPNGYLIIGWNTDFSGRKIGNYSQWSMQTIRELRQSCGFTAPVVAEIGGPWLSWPAIRAAYLSGRSIPIFMACRKDGSAAR